MGYKGSTPHDMGFFYAPYVPMQYDKVDVEARPLKENWTLETAEDLRAIHGLDAEAELANILAEEIQAEIAREMLRLATEKIEDEVPQQPLSFNDSEWFKALGDKYDNRPVVGRRTETSDTDGMRVALDLGENGG